MIMLTYKRTKILPKVLKHYCKTITLQKILVIWNDVGTPIPKYLMNLTKECDVELIFILSQENLLTNRYIPRDEIKTDCKFTNYLAS